MQSFGRNNHCQLNWSTYINPCTTYSKSPCKPCWSYCIIRSIELYLAKFNFNCTICTCIPSYRHLLNYFNCCISYILQQSKRKVCSSLIIRFGKIQVVSSNLGNWFYYQYLIGILAFVRFAFFCFYYQCGVYFIEFVSTIQIT